MAAKTKAVSDEELIAAIITAGSIKEAADNAGISPRSVYDRMKEPGFRAAYQEAKNDVLRGAVKVMNSKVTSAVETVADIMENREINAAVRLQAAQTIITNAVKLSVALETSEQTSIETADPFGFARMYDSMSK